jgi:23S rRNA pseudouridine1911/1915/1917 synthase
MTLILFADSQIAVVRKPAGVNTVAWRDEKEPTLVDFVARELGGRRPRVVQRLDRDTTGVLVFARTREAEERLAQQFRRHSVLRRYVALARGQVRAGTLRWPIDGKPAVTHVEVLESTGEVSLIACRLETGRTHQIRIHLARSGHPLVGERHYARLFAARRAPPGPKAPRILLHAMRLGFVHPSLESWVEFSEPLPEDLAAGLRS